MACCFFETPSKNLRIRKSESISQASACVSEADIRKWFTQILEGLKKDGLDTILQDPKRVFNVDESGFRTCPASGRVFAQKGEKNVYQIDKGKSKECITVLFTISADGKTRLPTVVYPYQRMPERVTQSVPSDWGVALSPSGWMTGETFLYFLQNIFHPYLIENKIDLPVILFVDGHRSHLTYECSKLASALKIEIIALYPNCTHILQPADVALFGPVKQLWKKALRQWLNESDSEIVTKQNFVFVLQKVTEMIKPDCIINGLRACGLCPFDADSVNYSKIITKHTLPVTNEGDKPEKTMPFSKFKEVIGQDMISKFIRIKDIVADEQNNEHFFTLFRLWEFFESKTEENVKPDVAVNTVHSVDLLRCNDPDNNSGSLRSAEADMDLGTIHSTAIEMPSKSPIEPTVNSTASLLPLCGPPHTTEHADSGNCHSEIELTPEGCSSPITLEDLCIAQAKNLETSDSPTLPSAMQSLVATSSSNVLDPTPSTSFAKE